MRVLDQQQQARGARSALPSRVAKPSTAPLTLLPLIPPPGMAPRLPAPMGRRLAALTLLALLLAVRRRRPAAPRRCTRAASPCQAAAMIATWVQTRCTRLSRPPRITH